MATGIKGSLSHFTKWWKKLRRRNRISRVKHVRSMEEIPKRIGATLYVVQRAGLARWAVLDCPFFCGARIHVNLMATRRPHWTLTEVDGRVSVLPSLWQPKHACGSHFFISHNRIKWVREAI